MIRRLSFRLLNPFSGPILTSLSVTKILTRNHFRPFRITSKVIMSSKPLTHSAMMTILKETVVNNLVTWTACVILITQTSTTLVMSAVIPFVTIIALTIILILTMMDLCAHLLQ